jgi:transcriptional regulator with GAF, ATPase, and Fis domain
MMASALMMADIKQSEVNFNKEDLALPEEIDREARSDEIIGSSAALQKVLSLVSKVAPTDATVLITGETGTGKELIARSIHRQSERSSRALVCVNCAAVPRDLIASELFGHEKGSFTGALQRRLGRFELADGGTIFLDEVGELPLETQIALLRVLQEHEFERVGGTRSIHANVRVIAATNRNLQAAVREGTFRSDLFYRLDIFPIVIPPLRERREDVPVLVEYFVARCARNLGKNIQRITKQSLDLLRSYHWPGNIRELQNVLDRSVIMCETETLSVDKVWLAEQSLSTDSKIPAISSERLATQELA